MISQFLIKNQLICVKFHDQISECGELFAASQGETEHSEQMDVVFVQVCIVLFKAYCIFLVLSAWVNIVVQFSLIFYFLSIYLGYI